MSYIKEERLGTGAYGKVYKTLKIDENGNNERSAVKRNTLADETDSLGSLREMDILVANPHYFIIPLKQVHYNNPFNCPLSPNIENGIRDDNLFFEFPLSNGVLPSFQNEKNNVLTNHDYKLAILQLLLSLEWLHANFIMHRDIKPHNLLLFTNKITVPDDKNKDFSLMKDVFSYIRLADFGLSNIYSRTEYNDLNVITWWFRPPEIFLGYRGYTTKVDMWSVGMMIINYIINRPLLSDAKEESKALSHIYKLFPYMPLERCQEMQTPCYRVAGSYEYKTEEEALFELFKRENKLDSPLVKMFLPLLPHMLRVDPKKRWSATQCLNALQFNDQRDFIDNVRNLTGLTKTMEINDNEHQYLNPNFTIDIHLGSEHQFGINEIIALFNEMRDYKKYCPLTRAKFLAIDIFDRVLLYLSKLYGANSKNLTGNMIPSLNDAQKNGRLLPTDHSKIYSYCSAYIAFKYYATNVPNLSNYFWCNKYLRIQKEDFLLCEKYIIENVLGRHIYKPLLYDRISLIHNSELIEYVDRSQTSRLKPRCIAMLTDIIGRYPQIIKGKTFSEALNIVTKLCKLANDHYSKPINDLVQKYLNNETIPLSTPIVNNPGPVIINLPGMFVNNRGNSLPVSKFTTNTTNTNTTNVNTTNVNTTNTTNTNQITSNLQTLFQPKNNLFQPKNNLFIPQTTNYQPKFNVKMETKNNTVNIKENKPLVFNLWQNKVPTMTFQSSIK
jgi:serine/threonine protein kinase